MVQNVSSNTPYVIVSRSWRHIAAVVFCHLSTFPSSPTVKCRQVHRHFDTYLLTGSHKYSINHQLLLMQTSHTFILCVTCVTLRMNVCPFWPMFAHFFLSFPLHLHSVGPETFVCGTCVRVYVHSYVHKPAVKEGVRMFYSFVVVIWMTGIGTRERDDDSQTSSVGVHHSKISRSSYVWWIARQM